MKTNNLKNKSNNPEVVIIHATLDDNEHINELDMQSIFEYDNDLTNSFRNELGRKLPENTSYGVCDGNKFFINYKVKGTELDSYNMGGKSEYWTSQVLQATKEANRKISGYANIQEKMQEAAKIKFPST